MPGPVKEVNKSPIILDDPAACRMVKRRALAESRSARSALRLTIIESLQERFPDGNDRPDACSLQAKNRRSFREGIVEKSV